MRPILVSLTLGLAVLSGAELYPTFAQKADKTKDAKAAKPTPTAPVEEKVVCPKDQPTPPKISRADVYKDKPYQGGEVASYEIHYGGILVGLGSLEVKAPYMYEGQWQQNFYAMAKTGDWYKNFFIAEDYVTGYSRPWDFGATKFYMEQNEGKMFSKPFVQKKWLDFDQKNCRVNEKVKRPGKPDKADSYDLVHGAIDALSASYKLRTLNYQVGKLERFLVYTSEKNWWLEANPLQMEQIKVPAGTFDAVKIKLQTYIGKELQQKGDVYIWIDQKTPDRPLVQIKGEIKIGSVWMELSKFKSGRESK
jgi:hypothetical protein